MSYQFYFKRVFCLVQNEFALNTQREQHAIEMLKQGQIQQQLRQSMMRSLCQLNREAIDSLNCGGGVAVLNQSFTVQRTVPHGANRASLDPEKELQLQLSLLNQSSYSEVCLNYVLCYRCVSSIRFVVMVVFYSRVQSRLRSLFICLENQNRRCLSCRQLLKWNIK